MTERNPSLGTTLDKGVAELGLALSSSQKQKLLDYVALLGKWNSVYNLTAIRDPQQMMIQHILDSLAIVPAVSARNPSTALDVGSGGGLPGIVLAIMLPALRVTLNDIVHKKTAFQSQAKAQLGLSNLSVTTGRVENLRPGIEMPEKFDVIVSRAFAELSDFVTLSRHLVAVDGRILVMKGVKPDAEVARLPEGATVLGIERLNVPMLDTERHLVEIAVGPE
ncbi:rRNA small subunit methyltransferase, glucose inhibited division protein GidB [Candidatus Paraburkholderia kirkii UZHbot1]|uniref:Ribosomal RNA small subunit methyltransferase G n=1 Tax=Candidatus Paraburkholderia kirkii UZHbot1 TaxID=1055526 RepID=G4MC22_9BURK|nr:rRNA small subunit methyltransferase, glucose inhibited division protein GidB [Candidatus Paraburkholderia kirkii UZHbot1]